MDSAKVALIHEGYIDSIVDVFILNPLRKAICPFDVVKITGDLDAYPIWISPVELGMGEYMYEITLNGEVFSVSQIQALMKSITPPLALDRMNKVRQFAGKYSIIVLTSRSNYEEWPNLEAVLRLVATLL